LHPTKVLGGVYIQIFKVLFWLAMARWLSVTSESFGTSGWQLRNEVTSIPSARGESVLLNVSQAIDSILIFDQTIPELQYREALFGATWRKCHSFPPGPEL
jgi:hypothetical protein